MCPRLVLASCLAWAQEHTCQVRPVLAPSCDPSRLVSKTPSRRQLKAKSFWKEFITHTAVPFSAGAKIPARKVQNTIRKPPSWPHHRVLCIESVHPLTGKCTAPLMPAEAERPLRGACGGRQDVHLHWGPFLGAHLFTTLGFLLLASPGPGPVLIHS